MPDQCRSQDLPGPDAMPEGHLTGDGDAPTHSSPRDARGSSAWRSTSR